MSKGRLFFLIVGLLLARQVLSSPSDSLPSFTPPPVELFTGVRPSNKQLSNFSSQIVFDELNTCPENRKCHSLVLVPQFHQHPSQPMHWSEIGNVIKGSQSDIARYIYWRLKNNHVLEIGSEGSSAVTIDVTRSHERLAWLWHDLRLKSQAWLENSAEWDRDSNARIATECTTQLKSLLLERAKILDGISLGALWFEHDRHNDHNNGSSPSWSLPKSKKTHRKGKIHRFGLEDATLLTQGIQVQKAIARLHQERRIVTPDKAFQEQPEQVKMWRRDYPQYRRERVIPIRQCMDHLKARIKEWTREGDVISARSARGLLSKIRQIESRHLKIEKLEARYTSFLLPNSPQKSMNKSGINASVDQRTQQSPEDKGKDIEAQITRLSKEYEDIVHAKRNASIAAKIVKRHEHIAQNANQQAEIVIVVGANHIQELSKALKEAFGAKRIRNDDNSQQKSYLHLKILWTPNMYPYRSNLLQ